MVALKDKQTELATQLSLVGIFRSFQEHSAQTTVGEDLKLEYFLGRLDVLEQYWSEFSERHARLSAWSADLDSDYFSQDAHSSVENLYLIARSYLKNRIREETPDPVVQQS